MLDINSTFHDVAVLHDEVLAINASLAAALAVPTEPATTKSAKPLTKFL